MNRQNPGGLARTMVLGLLVTATLGTRVFADTILTTGSIADAFVTTGANGSLSSSNFGAAGALAIAAPGLPQGEFQTVMQFQLSGLTSSLNSLYGAGSWSVQSVTLELTASPHNNAIFNNISAGNFNISLMQNNSWVEGTGTGGIPSNNGISYNTLQSTYINTATDQALGTFSFAGGSSGTANYSLTLSSGLISDLEDGNNVSLRLYAADDVVSYLFSSRQGGSAVTPTFVVDVVPEPGSMALCALGLGMLFLWRIKRTGTIVGTQNLSLCSVNENEIQVRASALYPQIRSDGTVGLRGDASKCADRLDRTQH